MQLQIDIRCGWMKIVRTRVWNATVAWVGIMRFSFSFSFSASTSTFISTSYWLRGGKKGRKRYTISYKKPEGPTR